MNKFVGYMNVVLLVTILIVLGVRGVHFEQRAMVVSMVLMLVPVVLTMFAMEPEPRFLHAALITNTVVIFLYVLGTGWSAGTLFLAPFVINISALARVWKDQKDEQDQPTGDPAAEPMYEDPAENYFLRHWRGQLTLPVSYWVNNWGVTVLCWGLLVVANKFLADISLRMQSATVQRLGSEVVTMARNPVAHAESPQELCEASLRFYEAVRSLPMSERILAARGLFQGVAE